MAGPGRAAALGLGHGPPGRAPDPRDALAGLSAWLEPGGRTPYGYLGWATAGPGPALGRAGRRLVRAVCLARRAPPIRAPASHPLPHAAPPSRAFASVPSPTRPRAPPPASRCIKATPETSKPLQTQKPSPSHPRRPP